MGLFGDEFDIDLSKKPKAKALVKKITVDENSSNEDTKKVLKSKVVDLDEKLRIIKERVLKVLGKQKEKVQVIKTREEFHKYIDNAIASGIIAVDTETNNSLDPVTCQLMGPCLYYPNAKQAYIPLNHRDPHTKERLPWQLTEQDCKEELQRLIDSKTLIVMHNGKFDYEVLKCTCGLEMPIYWDTMIGARLLDENELAGLKWQYINKIDPSQEKYDIEALFESVLYTDVEPEIFALYAATDSKMTLDLYNYQKPIFEEQGNERLYWVFKNIELPIVTVTAEMELHGVCVDVEFGKKLKAKYSKKLEIIDQEIQEDLKELEPKITAWRLSPEANEKTRRYAAEKSKMTQEKLEQLFPLVDENGKRYAIGKTKAEQLEDPINLASPSQLAILLYDILECPQVSKKKPRGTGEEELKAIAEERPDLKFCKAMLDRREVVKLITTYIDVIPELAKHWPDGRVRAHLSSMGTDTGRYSSGGQVKFLENDKPVTKSGINIQNIPSHSKDIRLLFRGENSAKVYEAENSEPFVIPEITEVETTDGYKYCDELKVGDLLIVDSTNLSIKSIRYDSASKTYSLEV